MPIYAYRCDACSFAKDVLQKMSDAMLSLCPECGKDALRKQVTAAGFQLKGSGWYVTDFRGGSGGASAASTSAPAEAGGSASGGKASTGGEATKPAAAPAAVPAVAAPAVPAAASDT
ncbi:MAG: FmdB family zinc ribbon protein [Burkholderia sp.]